MAVTMAIAHTRARDGAGAHSNANGRLSKRRRNRKTV